MQLPAITPSLSAPTLVQPAVGASKNSTDPGAATTQTGEAETSPATKPALPPAQSNLAARR